MSSVDPLLRLAIDDNVAWCRAVCKVHGSVETTSFGTWANLSASPPFYPNIITRQAGVQEEVEKVASDVNILNRSRQWGIKDSFCDLRLADKGFEKVLSGSWYGGTLSANETPTDWTTVQSPDQLRSWEEAWDDEQKGMFSEDLLSDQRIRFWVKGGSDVVEAGFISFDSGPAVGISNWFSRASQSLAHMGALQAASVVSRRRPIVCWSADDTLRGSGLTRLGPLQVWISKTDEQGIDSRKS